MHALIPSLKVLLHLNEISVIKLNLFFNPRKGLHTH